MEKRAGRAAAELCGVVLGAGFASGREIAAFFTRFGSWSWLGVAGAAIVMGGVCRGVLRRPGVAGMPVSWAGTWREMLWRGLFALLLGAAGGAMLAAGGELAALVLPLPRAQAIGWCITLVLAWLMSRRENPALAQVSRGLIAVLVCVLGAGLFLPVSPGVAIVNGSPWASLPMGVCYGGFNAALAAPVMASVGEILLPEQRRRCSAAFAWVTAALLCFANGVLLRHGALVGESMPFVRLLSALGQGGYLLGAGALYLASLTTLTACMKGLRGLLGRHGGWSWLAMAALSLGGMGNIVGVAYPVLGGSCALLLGYSLRQKT